VTARHVRLLIAVLPAVTLLAVGLYFTFGYDAPLPRPDQMAAVGRSGRPMLAGTTTTAFDAAQRLDPHAPSLAALVRSGEVVELHRCNGVRIVDYLGRYAKVRITGSAAGVQDRVVWIDKSWILRPDSHACARG
jgi:hypothetical protein